MDAGDHGIYQLRFNADGEPVGEISQVNTYIPDAQLEPSTALLSDGGWVVTWSSYSESDSGYLISQRRYNADGDAIGDEISVSSRAIRDRSGPSVTAFTDGGWVVTWSTVLPDESGFGIYQQRYGSNGNAVGEENKVNTSTVGKENDTAVAVLPDGGWIVTWSTAGQDGSGSGVYQQRYASNGNGVGGEIKVNSFTAGAKDDVDVAVLSDGGWVITWASFGQDGSNFGVYQQRYKADGSVSGGEKLVNTSTVGHQSEPSIAALDDGGWIVTWNATTGRNLLDIYQQLYDSDGNKVGSEVVVNYVRNNNQQQPTITSLADGGWVVAWADDTPRSSVHVKYFSEAIFGSATSEKIVGTSGNEYLVGYGGNDTLNGEGGADVLIGGKGDDTYFVDNLNAIVQEKAGEGTDLVIASISYTLTEYVQNLKLTGTSRLRGTGNEQDNKITGNSSANQLDGKGGVDILVGGGGSDTYFVDSSADKVMEKAREGTDLVNSSASFVLSDNVENLTLIGTKNINGTGNDIANTIRGNAYNNRLDGRGGADIMIGSAGNDTYIVDSKADRVQELAGQGTDLIVVPFSFSLTDDVANIENLTLSGSKNIDGTGDNLVNRITGNSGNNVLDGLGGADTLIGGKGNDSYYVDISGDKITELAGEGVDTVYSEVSYALSGSLENLTLIGFKGISGAGNGSANVLVGNSGNNKLSGYSGKDRIDGGGGSDVINGGKGIDRLYGGSGADIFVFAKGDTGNTRVTADTIFDFSSSDSIDLSAWDANSKKSGAQEFNFVGSKAFSGKAGELRYTKNVSDTRIEGDTNGDGKSDFVIYLDDAFALKVDHFLF
ncbi:calcium-binding protein [Shinella sp. CPCC 101442]|uniref:calcium-binding protein n=1 Tax=Shinella sp. CPCC 101442 TaxID=2932265 RepID=UPI0027E58767|nr:calcium-binding protein [Shinella sp. CPCC 101442]